MTLIMHAYCLVLLIAGHVHGFVVSRTAYMIQSKISYPTRTLLQHKDSLNFKSAKNETTDELLGFRESAAFSFDEQSLEKWVQFVAATGSVLAIIAYVWFLPVGPKWGNLFLSTVQNGMGTTSPDATIFGMLTIFAVFHSGLAALRPFSEKIVGARIWRVIFAMVSLPLALSCISYFVNHCHEGVQLWDLTAVPGLHVACWVTDFISFLFLYPATFNLLEIAAVEKPNQYLWENGIMRITRHPQAIGQIMWCAAHATWIGTSTTLAACSVLVLHHLYSIWHGDRRLEFKYGESFEIFKQRTSIIPFQAIIEGRQDLPSDFYAEFFRGPYAIVVLGTVAAYFAHPYMMAGAALLGW